MRSVGILAASSFTRLAVRVDLPEPSHPTMAITRTGVELIIDILR